MESQRSTVILQGFLADPKNCEAFGKFARKYQSRIKRCCLARGLQDADADDLAAAILLRFCERDVFDGFVFQSKEKFYGWLSKVVRHAVLTFHRDRGRKPDAWSVGNANAQDSLQRATEEMVRDLKAVCEEDRARVERACARVEAGVEAKTWQAFHLSVYEGRAVKEVTEQLGMTNVAVWQAVSRVKRKLREELSDLHDPRDGEK
jgi:RNA polymerase sigma factor (sigma-70 family)